MYKKHLKPKAIKKNLKSLTFTILQKRDFKTFKFNSNRVTIKTKNILENNSKFI